MAHVARPHLGVLDLDRVAEDRLEPGDEVEESVRVPKARFTGPGADVPAATARASTSTTVPTKVKSRLWRPSPCTSSGRPFRAASTKRGTTAA